MFPFLRTPRIPRSCLSRSRHSIVHYHPTASDLPNEETLPPPPSPPRCQKKKKRIEGKVTGIQKKKCAEGIISLKVRQRQGRHVGLLGVNLVIHEVGKHLDFIVTVTLTSLSKPSRRGFAGEPKEEALRQVGGLMRAAWLVRCLLTVLYLLYFIGAARQRERIGLSMRMRCHCKPQQSALPTQAPNLRRKPSLTKCPLRPLAVWFNSHAARHQGRKDVYSG